jgi:LCP family protein required for cell wall assembly
METPLKKFLKQFLLYFIILTLILIPVRMVLDRIGGIRLFSGTESIIKDLGVLVDEDSPFYNEFRDSKRVNVLVMGVNDGLTDTIMLASYDMKNQRVDVISVPRDTYYYREGYRGAAAHKINAIYSADGAVGTAKAVSDVLLGIPINYYAVISYDGVEKVVDSMGGVPMNIPAPMRYSDPFDTPPLKIDIPAGEQVLNGGKAVEYLRYRSGYPEGDIGRVKAQQVFVKAAFKQALGKDLIKVIKTTLANVDSDLPLGMAVKIGTKGLGLEAEGLNTWLTPGKSGTTNGASYWRTDSAQIEEMIRQIYSPPEKESDEESPVE